MQGPSDKTVDRLAVTNTLAECDAQLKQLVGDFNKVLSHSVPPKELPEALKKLKAGLSENKEVTTELLRMLSSDREAADGLYGRVYKEL